MKMTSKGLIDLFKNLSRAQTIILAVSFLAVLLVATKTYESTTYAFFSYSTAAARYQATDHSLPTFIYIPSLEISLPIEETSIHYGIWGISQDAASHLASTPVPGENGNIVIYGRNTTDSFGRLTSLIKGDTLLVTTQNGITHEYKVISLTIVSPTESSLIDETDEETLTLYTSYGFGDTKRFVVQAKPTSSE